MKTSRWELLARHFDAALPLSRPEREAYVNAACQGDASLRAELLSLLQAYSANPEFLEKPAGSDMEGTAHLLRAGESLGLWKIVRPLGQGGMGEVYEVERADGQFEQRAALKVMRASASRFQDRFNAERQILARLEHPGIVRLLDGGTTADLRPYAVMEFIAGEPITQWCNARSATLAQRLELFTQVCEAVQYAHGHLIVHRDIKPSNVLVDSAGRAHLLDFGIAKLLDAADDGNTPSGGATAMFLTPDYAAPEQLTGEPVTTATDVHALGLLLHELLSGARPRGRDARSIAHLVRTALDETIPPVSDAAAAAGAPGVPARLLRGDIDAIVAKCLRVRADARYSGAEALRQDVLRSQRGEPVSARATARWYRIACLARRYRWAAAGIAAVLIAMGAGTGIALWQSKIASQEAHNAAATRDFLIEVFHASDPRAVGDRPPGQITARELLDNSVERIKSEFAGDPATQLALLGVVSEIYGYWGDQRFADLQVLRKNLAEQHFGRTHTTYIETTLMDAWQLIYEQEYVKATALLTEIRTLIERGGHDDTVLQAQWWLARAEALRVGDADLRLQALENAVKLYARVAPDSMDNAVALANSGVAHFHREEFAAARSRNEQAIAAFGRVTTPADIELAMTWANLARSLQQLGDFTGAEKAYGEFKRIADPISRANSESISYWLGAADHARMLHMRGETRRAHESFTDVLGRIPADWDDTVHDVLTREIYAERLAAEGRTTEAVPLLEAAVQTYQLRPLREFDLRRARHSLGDAYARAGRDADAGRELGQSREEYLRKEPHHLRAVLAVRERWARWLLDQGRLEEAGAELTEVVRDAKGPSVEVALAQTDLSNLARTRQQPAAALRHSSEAVATLEASLGLHDVRAGIAVWIAHARALEASGRHEDALVWRGRAQELDEQLHGQALPVTAPR